MLIIILDDPNLYVYHAYCHSLTNVLETVSINNNKRSRISQQLIAILPNHWTTKHSIVLSECYRYREALSVMALIS